MATRLQPKLLAQGKPRPLGGTSRVWRVRLYSPGWGMNLVLVDAAVKDTDYEDLDVLVPVDAFGSSGSRESRNRRGLQRGAHGRLRQEPAGGGEHHRSAPPAQAAPADGLIQEWHNGEEFSSARVKTRQDAASVRGHPDNTDTTQAAHSGRVNTSRNSWLTKRSSRPTLTSLRSPTSTKACSHEDAV